MSVAEAADNVWVGADSSSNGAWSFSGNWTNNTAPNFQTNNRIVFQNNLTSTNMLNDIGWVDASDLIWDTTFNVSRTLNSTGGGIRFNTRVENLSSYTQTVASDLSGGLFGAGDIQLNPVNGDLVINGTIFNDNSKSYNIYGNTGRTLTLNSTLGPNATQSGVTFTIQRNTTVVLNTNQLWQGTTTMNGGTLLVGASGLLGNGTYTGAIVLGSDGGTNASLVLSNSGSQTLSGAISGSGSVTMAGSGTTTFTGTNTYSGTTSITNGTLVVSGLLGGGNYSAAITDNGTLVFSNSANQTLSGSIEGAGSLAMGGSGTTYLSVNNSYTGGTLVSQGTLMGGGSGSFGSGAIVLGNGSTGANNIVLAVNSSGNTTITNAITVANLGTGLVSIGGTNTGSGNYNQWSGVLTLNRNVQLFASDTSTRSTFDGQITGAGGITVTSGRVTLGNTNNNFSGPVVVNNGAILQLDVANGLNELLPNASSVTVNGSLNFASGGGTETIGSLSGTGTISSVVSGIYSLIVGNSNSTTFSGVINNGTGTIGLTQSGSGTLTLTGNNTYTGTTTITNGGIQVLNFASFGSGARNYAIASNSVVVLNATSNITAASGSSAITGSGTLLVTNGLLLTTNNSILTIAMGTGGLINVASGSTIRNGGWKNINWTNNQASMMLDGAVDIWDGQDIFIDALNGNGAVTNSDAYRGNINLTLGVANGSGTFTGQLTAPNLSVIKSGTGTQILAGTNTYTNSTTISGGTLVISGLLGNGSYAASITDNASLVFSNSGSQTLSGAISGSGTFTMAGAGTTLLSGSNSYLGGTYVTAGILRVGTNTALRTNGVVMVTGGTLDLGAFTNTVGAFTLSNGVTTNGSLNASSYLVGSGTISVSLVGTGALTQNGVGTTTLNASNSYSGGTFVNSGVLAFTVSNAFGGGLVTLTNGALLAYGGGGAMSVTNGVTIATGSSGIIVNGSNSLLTLSGTLAKNGSVLTLRGGSGGITVSGAITGSSAGSDLVVDGGVVTLTNSNSYNGPTYIINGGSLNADAAFALPVANGLTSVYLDQTNGGAWGSGSSTLSLGTAQSIASLSGLSSSSVRLSSNALTISNATGSTVFAGSITGGGGSLVKNGASSQTLSGSNSYTGGTIINAGTLVASNTSALGTGTVTLSGGALSLPAGLTVSSLIWNRAATIALPGAGSANFLTVAGAASLTGSGSTNIFDLTGVLLTTNALKLFAFGTNAFTASQFALTGVSGYTLSISNSALWASYLITDFYVGSNAVATTSTISSGIYAYGNTYIGYTNTSSNNLLTIANSGTLLTNSTSLYVGYGGPSNSMVVSNGAQVVDSNGFIGFSNTSTNNSVLITGSGSSWSNSGKLTVGSAGSGTLTVANGGLVIALGGVTIASNSGSAGTMNIGSLGGSDTAGVLAATSITFGTGSGRINFNQTDAFTLTNSVTGSGALYQLGSGTSIITASNSYSGGTFVTGGTLVASNSNALAGGNVTVSGGVLNLTNISETVGLFTISGGSLSGSSTLTATNRYQLNGGTVSANLGVGTITVGGTSTLNGRAGASVLTITNGILTLSSAGLLTNTASLTINGGSLALAGSQTITSLSMGNGTVSGIGTETLSVSSIITLTNVGASLISGSLIGNATLTQSGTGTTTLTGSNGFSGGVIVSGGTLVASNANALAGGSVNVRSGTLNLADISETVGAMSLGNGTITGSSTLTMTNGLTATNSGVALISETLAGSGSLVQSGAGTTTLSSSNAYTGGTFVSGGMLVANNSNALAGGNVTVSGGVLNLTNISEAVGAVTLGNGSITGGGTLTSTNGFTATNGGNALITVSLSGSGVGFTKGGAGTTTLTGSNSFTGGVTLNAGTLAIGNGAAFGTGTVTVAGNSTILTLANLTVTNAYALSNTITFNAGGNTLTNSGVISGAGGLIVTNGTLVLSTSNSYAGATIITNGTLVIATAGALGTNNVGINSGGLLSFNESGSDAISSVISGSGSLSQVGSGTTT